MELKQREGTFVQLSPLEFIPSWCYLLKMIVKSLCVYLSGFMRLYNCFILALITVLISEYWVMGICLH